MNRKIFLALFTSEIGNSFYILFVSVVLLKLNYSASFVSGAIALTILPNLLLGPWLGRMVDRGNKKIMHTYFNIALALIVNLIGFSAFFLDHSLGKILIPALMIIYNCLFSPLNTIIYQYVVPKLDENEAKAFIKWEKYQALGIFISSLISFIVIKYNLQLILLPIDGITFIFCSFIIGNNWKNENSNKPKTNVLPPLGIKHLLIENFSFNTILISIVACLLFIFFVDSHSYNAGILFFKELHAPIEFIPLLVSVLSLFNILGSIIFEKLLIKENNNHVQIFCLILISFGLIGLSWGIAKSSLLTTILSLIFIQMVEPIWSTTNNIMMRSQIKENSYGEFFGIFRIFRSLTTFAGIYLYGFSQEANFLSGQVMVGALFIFLPPIFYFSTTSYKKLEMGVQI